MKKNAIGLRESAKKCFHFTQIDFVHSQIA